MESKIKSVNLPNYVALFAGESAGDKHVTSSNLPKDPANTSNPLHLSVDVYDVELFLGLYPKHNLLYVKDLNPFILHKDP